MVKTFGRALVLAVFLGATLNADVKYTIHTEFRQVSRGTSNELSQEFSKAIAEMLPNGFDQIVTSSEKATRVEIPQAFPGMPPGIMIIRDENLFVLDPAAKTYYRDSLVLTADIKQALARLKPVVSTNPTGEFKTIDGRRAERVLMTMTMPMSGVPGESRPPGYTTEMVLTFDMWMTDAIKAPASTQYLNQKWLAQLGFGDLTPFADRFMLEGVMRINILTGVEIVMTVKDIVEGKVPDSLFDVPPDYKEVPRPGGRGGSGG